MGHIVTTAHSTDALMASAGCAPLPSAAPRKTTVDVVLERADNDHWVVTMISPRALDWATSELCCALRPCFSGSMHLDMMSTDRLLKRARAQGFRTEFVSLGGKDVF